MATYHKRLYVQGFNLKNVLVVGAGDLGQKVVERLENHPEIGFSVTGYLSHSPEKVGKDFKGHGVLGLYQDVAKQL